MSNRKRNILQDTRKASGFTLVEVLVVIAILGVLAAVLTPVFLSTRERARQTVCAGNLSQLYKAVSMYANDNDGFRPAYEDGASSFRLNGQEMVWPDQSAELVRSLQPYARSTEIWFCPDDPLRGKAEGKAGNAKRHPATSYSSAEAFRINPTGPPMPSPLFLSRISASKVALFEDDIMPYMAGTPDDTYLYTHNQRFNVVFCDGHVRSMSPHDDDCQGYCH